MSHALCCVCVCVFRVPNVCCVFFCALLCDAVLFVVFFVCVFPERTCSVGRATEESQDQGNMYGR